MRLLTALIILLSAWLPSSDSLADGAQQTPLAPGYSRLAYPLPEAGSYQLPAFKDAGNGTVLDESGNAVELHDVLGSRYSLLAFMYSSCSDVNGCPLSAYVFYQLKTAMNKDPLLAKNLRLVSLSFDPERDTPEAMRLYGNNFKYARGDGQWRFITTSGEQQLQPLLNAYAQDVQRDMSINGEPGEDYSHVLRVFLIDPEKKVRNIYSVSFLHADLIITDVKTLLLEETKAAPTTVAKNNVFEPIHAGPGDVKTGYESHQYETRSRAVQHRQGKSLDLLKLAKNPPLGLPPVPVPDGFTLSNETILLGRKLFFDRRLSLNDTFSCAMCHIPEQGFSSNELSKAVGIEGRSVRRNTPTVLNSAYATRLFHDGREDSLAQQAWGPLLAKNEMGNPSIGHVINKIKGLPDYNGLFENAFNGAHVSMQTLGDALAAYQMTLNAADSPFDRWFYGKQKDALSEEAQAGFTLFRGKAGCSGCHRLTPDHALFTDNAMHNTGVGYLLSQPDKASTRRVQLAPGVSIDIKQSVIDKVGLPEPADLGLYEITENPSDRWKFKTPTLRNVALTAPYMHDGSLSTLAEVVDFYDSGGVPNELQDPRIRPLQLTDSEKAQLVAFLEALTGSGVKDLVADAFDAPVGDIQSNDPRWRTDPSNENRL